MLTLCLVAMQVIDRELALVHSERAKAEVRTPPSPSHPSLGLS